MRDQKTAISVRRLEMKPALAETTVEIITAEIVSWKAAFPNNDDGDTTTLRSSF